MVESVWATGDFTNSDSFAPCKSLSGKVGRPFFSWLVNMPAFHGRKDRGATEGLDRMEFTPAGNFALRKTGRFPRGTSQCCSFMKVTTLELSAVGG